MPPLVRDRRARAVKRGPCERYAPGHTVEADWKRALVTASQQVIASATGGQSWHWRSLAHVATHTSEDGVEWELEVIREDDERAVELRVEDAVDA